MPSINLIIILGSKTEEAVEKKKESQSVLDGTFKSNVRQDFKIIVD